MPELSLVYLTYRPGGIDLLGNALKGCVGDWELIVVDDYAGRVERGAATAFLKEDCGLPLRWHGPSKPKSIPDTRGALANAMNTGSARCSGATTVFLHDYTIPPRTLVVDWKEAIARHGPNKLIHGVAIEFRAPKPEFHSDVVTWLTPPRLHAVRPWVPEVFELFYLGVPTRFIEAINGVDERGDHCGPTIMNALTTQARLLGYDFGMDRKLLIKMIDHRHWEESDASDALWKIKGHVQHVAEPLWGVPSRHPYKFSRE